MIKTSKSLGTERCFLVCKVLVDTYSLEFNLNQHECFRERAGKMTLLNAKVVLAILSRARPQDVWHLLAHEASNHDGQVSERRLRAVLESLVEVPCTLGEEAQIIAERTEVVELLLRDCFTQEWIKVKDQGSVERWFAESVNPVLCWLWNLARMRVSKQGMSTTILTGYRPYTIILKMINN